MSDPLSYSDAIVSAVLEIAKRSLSFALVCVGAAFLGLHIHHMPTAVASYAGTIADVGALVKTADVYVGNSLGVLAHNMGVMWFSPWTMFYVIYFGFVCAAEDIFRPLLFLAVVHSIHAFCFMQGAIPLTGSAFAASLALLILSDLATVALVLWWRNVRENAPVEFPPSGSATPFA